METETLKGRLPGEMLNTFRRNLLYLSKQAGGYYQLAGHDEAIGKDISGIIIMGCGGLKAKKIMNHLDRFDLLDTNIVPNNEIVPLPKLKKTSYVPKSNGHQPTTNGHQKALHVGNGFVKFIPNDGNKIEITFNGAKFSINSDDTNALKAILKAIKEVSRETV